MLAGAVYSAPFFKYPALADRLILGREMPGINGSLMPTCGGVQGTGGSLTNQHCCYTHPPSLPGVARSWHEETENQEGRASSQALPGSLLQETRSSSLQFPPSYTQKYKYPFAQSPTEISQQLLAVFLWQAYSSSSSSSVPYLEMQTCTISRQLLHHFGAIFICILISATFFVLRY
jgi:hypothetical protein